MNTEKRIDRNYENNPVVNNDITNLVYQLAVFCTEEKKIYKLNVINYPGIRFETNGERKSKFIDFSQGVLFNFTNPIEFDKYYQESCHSSSTRKKDSKENIYKWLCESINRVGLMPSRGKEEEVE